jgi:hypothetical protein
MTIASDPNVNTQVQLVSGGQGLVVKSGGTLKFEQGGVLIESVADALTAHAGGGQANALPLPALINRVTTVATIADSVLLPLAAGVVGVTITVINAATNSLQVFAPSPDTINGVATGTGVAVGGGKTASFFTTVAGAWHMQLSA